MSRRLPIMAALALVGFAISCYLLTVHLGFWNAVCLGVGDCELVNTSRFSEFLGLPVALLGMAAYAALFILALAAWRGIARAWMLRALFFAAAGGVAFSLYLTYIEVFVLQAICPWCVTSALLVAIIGLLSAWELRVAEMGTLQPG